MDLPAAVGRVAATAFVLLALAASTGISPGPFDQSIQAEVADTPERTRQVWNEVSDILAYGTAGGAAFLAVASAMQARRWDRLALIGLAIAAVATNDLILKPAFDVARPPTATAASAAFPSGHTSSALLLAGTLLIADPPTRLSPAGGRLAFVAAVAALTGMARVLAGQHWPIDVLASWAYGTAVLGILVQGATDPGAWRPSRFEGRPRS